MINTTLRSILAWTDNGVLRSPRNPPLSHKSLSSDTRTTRLPRTVYAAPGKLPLRRVWGSFPYNSDCSCPHWLTREPNAEVEFLSTIWIVHEIEDYWLQWRKLVRCFVRLLDEGCRNLPKTTNPRSHNQ